MNTDEHRCPKCGKPMAEQPQFPGLWLCPDYKTPLNTKPPYVYKCKGMELTEKGAADLENEINRLVAQSN